MAFDEFQAGAANGVLALTIPQRLRVPLTFLVVAVVCGLILYAVWYLEETTKEVRTVVVDDGGSEGVFAVEIREREGADLIVYCNEELFQEAFQKFAKELDISTEPLPVPGGPMVLALADVELPTVLQAPQRALRRALEQFSPSRVVLVGHSECLIYDTVGAWMDNPERIRVLQEDQIFAARNALLEWFPTTEVELYYAEKLGSRVEFHRFESEERTLRNTRMERN